jgi:ABC-type multidrug transport system fused ATPase/permease subunit
MALGYSLLFLAAVMISAWVGGLRGGLVATSLAIVCLSYYFIAPTYSIWISELNGLAWLVLFVVVSTLISSLNEARSRAETKLRAANQELESRVAERTAELTFRNEELQAEITERKRIAGENDVLIRDLQGALTRIKVLSGLLPVCIQCKKIRDNRGHWNEFETYISEHSDATVSQCICPECAKSLYPHYPFIDVERKDER